MARTHQALDLDVFPSIARRFNLIHQDQARISNLLASVWRACKAAACSAQDKALAVGAAITNRAATALREEIIGFILFSLRRKT